MVFCLTALCQQTASAADLQDAAATGNLAKVSSLLRTNPSSINLRDFDGKTALHHAAAQGHLAVVQLLVTNHANLQIRSRSGLTPLDFARGLGRREVVEYLQALPEAAAVRSPRTVPMSAPKAIPPAAPIPPLLSAAQRANYDEMMAILRSSPDQVSATDSNQMTGLHWAASKDYHSVALLLLTNKADPNLHAKNGDTPLHETTRVNSGDMARLLIKYGADPKATNRAGLSPSHLAALRGADRVLTTLLAEHADPNQPGRDGATPLEMAVASGKPALVKALLDAGANPSVAMGRRPGSLLHVAVQTCPTEVVAMLLARKPDLSVKDSEENTVMDLALQSGREDVISLLKTNGAPASPPKVFDGAEGRLIEYYKTADRSLRGGNAAAKREVLLALLPTREDIGKVFLKNTDKAWQVAEERNASLRKEVDFAVTQMPDEGEIVKIIPHEPSPLVGWAKDKGLIESSIPVHSLLVWRKGGMTLGDDYYLVNDKWLLMPRLDLVFSVLGGPVRPGR